jgi:predicted O-methyltransferase YrrM
VSDSKTTGFVDPSPVMQLTTAYWGAQTLFTANRLDLFPIIDGGRRTVGDIAAASRTHERPLGLLLKALVALGLLHESHGEYGLTPVSEALLVPGGPGYLGNAIRYSDDLYGTWGRLEQALREDLPQLPTAEYTGDDANRTRHFVRGMHDRALGIGNTMIELVDLTGRLKMLDVGGGPGTYSALFARRYPTLHSTVLDLPGVVAIAREIIAEMGMIDRVGVLPGDFNTTAFTEGNDVVLISGVFHRESEQACRTLIDRAFACLQSGGLLVVGDVFTDAGGSGPAFATLFGLNMLLTAPAGGVHADADVARWMEDAGFGSTEILPFPPPMPHRVVLGVKQ